MLKLNATKVRLYYHDQQKIADFTDVAMSISSQLKEQTKHRGTLIDPRRERMLLNLNKSDKSLLLLDI